MRSGFENRGETGREKLAGMGEGGWVGTGMRRGRRKRNYSSNRSLDAFTHYFGLMHT